MAINPIHAINFIRSHDLHSIFVILGSVMLVVTGGEAMYADMGHFGSTPIRISWFSIVYPALILNYLGQGAYMLAGKPAVGNNIFYSIVPSWGVYPMVLLATLATIIASQALISGAFSLAQQAVSLGLFPYLKIVHTHHAHEGQIYVPFINYALYVGCVSLVFTFQSSSRLAGAYGLAVSGVMLITSLAMIQIARYYWKWSLVKTLLLFVPLSLIDLTFLASNSLKLFEGGYIPLTIGLGLLIVMKTWQWGRSKVVEAFGSYPSMTLQDLISIKETEKSYIPRTIVVMTPKVLKNKTDNVPILKQMFWERYGMLPKNLIFLTVNILKQPYIHSNRFEIENIYHSKQQGSIISVNMKFGYMEDENVEEALRSLVKEKKIPLDQCEDWNIHIMHERLMRGNIKSIINKIRFAIFRFMLKNTDSADHFFGLGKKQPLSIEVIPVYIK